MGTTTTIDSKLASAEIISVQRDQRGPSLSRTSVTGEETSLGWGPCRTVKRHGMAGEPIPMKVGCRGPTAQSMWTTQLCD